MFISMCMRKSLIAGLGPGAFPHPLLAQAEVARGCSGNHCMTPYMPSVTTADSSMGHMGTQLTEIVSVPDSLKGRGSGNIHLCRLAAFFLATVDSV